MSAPALLALEDGTVFHGWATGAQGQTVGEVVFNTAMTGYQEALTDPSYHRQIITLTYPHIGNTGTNPEDEESVRAFAAGLIVRDVPPLVSNWRSRESLPDWLLRHGVVAISGIDTRKLTRILREKGALKGCIQAGEVNPEAALAAARECIDIQGLDLVREVTTRKRYEWLEGTWKLEGEPTRLTHATAEFHVVAYDLGLKQNLLRMFVDRGCRMTVVPAETTVEEVLELNPDGVFFSNGPGDPEPCTYAIEAIRELCERRIPLFGICLGHQLLGLASGAKSIKMKLGHHGVNHPIRNEATGKVMISSQNHNFVVDEDTLPGNLTPTYRSLFDGTLQGLARTDCVAMSLQGHPEASPGPHDVAPGFDDFVEKMREARA